jgi:hypothetical protein
MKTAKICSILLASCVVCACAPDATDGDAASGNDGRDNFAAGSNDEDSDRGTADKNPECEPKANEKDRCCKYLNDITADYIGYEAHSNGSGTGDNKLPHQCAQFVKDFYEEKLKHTFLNAWGSAGNAIASAKTELQPNGDRIFTSTSERPREMDILIFGGGSDGHAVLARDGIEKQADNKYHIPIIEENVALGEHGNNGPGGVCYRRVLVAEEKSGSWTVDSGIGYGYLGLIRHNLAGIYADGWRDDGVSQAFRDAYQAAYRDSGKKRHLGWAYDSNGGTPFVHEVRGIKLQDFVNKDAATRYGTDGQTALAYHAAGRKAYVLREGFWGAYKCLPGTDGAAVGGPERLGAPVGNEAVGNVNEHCAVEAGAPSRPYQKFERGCLRYDAGTGRVLVHLDSGYFDEAKTASCGIALANDRPVLTCKDECAAGVRECVTPSSLRQCVGPLADGCRHWQAASSCTSGLACEGGSCVPSVLGTFSPPVTTMVTLNSTVPDSQVPTVTPTVEPVVTTPPSSDGLYQYEPGPCTPGARRCPSDRTRYAWCDDDGEGGATRWTSFICGSGRLCTEPNGQCVLPVTTPTVTAPTVTVPTATAAPVDTVTPIVTPASGDPPHTIRCSASATALTVTVTGPITDALIAVPTRPYALMWGSDTAGGWPVPYRDGDPSNRTQRPWLGDASTYVLTMPAWTDRLNLYVADADSATRNSWFDLDLYMDGFVPWNVVGDCGWVQGLITRK